MTAAQKFRKKPVEIQAMQWKGGPAAATPVIDWILSNGATATWTEAHDGYKGPDGKGYDAEPECIRIETLEGTMRATVGDYIIRGVKGEFYPCKPDIFDATYDRVIEHAHITGITVTRQSVDEAAARPIEPADADVLTAIRARAAVIAQQFAAARLSPAELGYVVVIASLMEAANQLRACADDHQSLIVMRAEALDRLAEHTITLGEAETEGPKR